MTTKSRPDAMMRFLAWLSGYDQAQLQQDHEAYVASRPPLVLRLIMEAGALILVLSVLWIVLEAIEPAIAQTLVAVMKALAPGLPAIAAWKAALSGAAMILSAFGLALGSAWLQARKSE